MIGLYRLCSGDQHLLIFSRHLTVQRTVQPDYNQSWGEMLASGRMMNLFQRTVDHAQGLKTVHGKANSDEQVEPKLL